jgi:hypothetical protein
MNIASRTFRGLLAPGCYDAADLGLNKRGD